MRSRSLIEHNHVPVLCIVNGPLLSRSTTEQDGGLHCCGVIEALYKFITCLLYAILTDFFFYYHIQSEW